VLDSGVRPERADAARNRLRVLAAAERLFAERGVHAVTMEEVAAAAGVGKGTVYRRFTDKGGLAIALLDERERELQQALLIGAGTAGGDPRARLAAFLGAYLDLLDQHGDLVLMSETNSVGSRFRTGSYHFWRVHVAALLTDAGVPAPDLTAEVILAPLSAENYRHLRARPDHRREDLVAALLRLAG
jgi:AcrR family transcriptional regulator